MFKLFFFKILHNESKIICEVSSGNETKSNILILISVSGAKSLRIVENNFNSLWLEASEYMDINVHVSNSFYNCKNEYGEKT